MFQNKHDFVCFGWEGIHAEKSNNYKGFRWQHPIFTTISTPRLTISLPRTRDSNNTGPCSPQKRTTVKNGNDADGIRDVIYLMRRLMQTGERYTKELNKKFSVSAPQVASLLALLDDGSMSPSQIAKKIMVESSTVTGIIDRLEQKGLVARTRISPDRRVITVELTEAGRRLAENAPPPIQQKIVKGLRKIDESERAQIIQTLNRLTDMIDADDVDEEDEAVIV